MHKTARQAQLANPVRGAREITPSRTGTSQQRSLGYAGNQTALRRLSETRPHVQCKLQIGAVNDPLEAEADRVADHVMRMPDPESSAKPASSPTSGILYRAPAVEQAQALDEDMPLPGDTAQPQEVKSPSAMDGTIQRMCSSCAHEEEEKLQRKETAQYAPSAASAETMIQRPGSRLEPGVRDYFEPRFGRRFDQVRVHTGAEADASARSVSALAYTVGDNIVFRQDQYRPGSTDGKRLIAHELTHVVQQGAAGATSSVSRRAEDPLQAQTTTSGRMLQRWSIGDPVPGINTIVCDGAGNVSVQVGHIGNADETACLRDCVVQHEQNHRSDALAEKANICTSVVAGKTVRPDAGAQQKATEIASSNVEIACLQGKQPTASATCQPIIAARITQMEGYRNSFR